MTNPFWIDPLANTVDADITPSGVFDSLDVDLSEVARPADIAEALWLEALDDFIPSHDKDWAEWSLIFFFKHYLGSAATSAFADVHYELAAILQDPEPLKRVLALFPREHAKTTIVTFGFVLWCIMYRKKMNIVICSDSKLQAKEFLRNIKTEMETNQKLIGDFGDLVPKLGSKAWEEERASKGKWDETHIITRNQVQVKILSPGSQARGLNFNVLSPDPKNPGQTITHPQRPDLLICDDILNDKWIKNRTQRDKIDNWFFSPVFNAVDSECGDIVVIGTVLHHDDLLSRMWKDDDRTANWTKLKRPACGIDKDGNPHSPLWPGRWPCAKLAQRRQEIGSLAFAREFLLNPVDEASQFFNHEWFKFFIDPRSIPEEWYPHLVDQGVNLLPEDMLLMTAIDPAISKKSSADYTVVMTVGFSPSTRCYYVLDAMRERVTPEKQVREMIRQCKVWDRTQNGGGFGFAHIGFCVETYAYQAALKYWLKKHLDDKNMVGYRIHERKENNIDKITRCSGMSPMAEQRRLYFPVGMKRDLVTNQPVAFHPMGWLQEELNDFPNGAYDDGVDALQRAYSVLIRDELRYARSGFYGPQGAAGMEALAKSYSFMKQYMGL